MPKSLSALGLRARPQGSVIVLEEEQTHYLCAELTLEQAQRLIETLEWASGIIAEKEVKDGVA
ncbi:MAG: hypothetical protein V2A53_02635 [bacterium]